MSESASISLYLGVFLFSIICTYVGIKRHIPLITLIGILAPVALAAYRYNVGTDYIAYVNIYDAMKTFSLKDYMLFNDNNIEIGFFLVLKLAHAFSADAWLVFGISSFISVGFFYLALRRITPQHTVLMMYLYLMTIFPLTLNGVRQGIAISIVFYALTYAFDKRFLKFALWTGVAACFHVSALFVLPVYLLVVSAFRKKTIHTAHLLFYSLPAMLILLITVPAVANILVTLPFFTKYAKYLESATTIGIGIYTLSLVSAAVALIFSRRLISADRKQSAYIRLTLLSFIVTTLGLHSSTVFRFSFYLTPFILLVMCGFINIFSDRLGRRTAYTAIIVYGVIYFTIIYGAYHLGDIIPYNFIQSL